MACLLTRAKQLKADARIELGPRLLRGVDIDILEPLVIQRITLRLRWPYAFLPALQKMPRI